MKDKIMRFYKGLDHKDKMLFWFCVFIVIMFIIGLFMPSKAQAHGESVTNITVQEHYVENHVNSSENNKLVAALVASGQHNLSYDYGITSFSLASGFYKDEWGFSAAASRRPCKSCPLFAGSITTEGNDYAVGLSVGVRY